MSEQLEKNRGTFLPIAICLAFVAMVAVGFVQSSIPSTANASPAETVELEDVVNGTASIEEAGALVPEAGALPAPVADDQDQILEEDALDENGNEDVETVAYVEGAGVGVTPADTAVDGGEPFYSQC